ncbi:unnamed protein product [Didymodactylos carnosus]|uniref:Uncharacterized protein n=1 Tax=Didymodactylos carnosus TaxID=1234261 RepID=A0A815ZCE9_9BILA|nr:unnamed protein product [Didymodactylos carnosus]CAF4447727.1 unnamed protein product [Didymodactylos carnosus]
MNKNSLIKYFQEVNKYAKEYADLTSKITTMSNQDDIIITDAQQTKSQSQQSSKMLTASLEIARKFLENLNSTTQLMNTKDIKQLQILIQKIKDVLKLEVHGTEIIKNDPMKLFLDYYSDLIKISLSSLWNSIQS